MSLLTEIPERLLDLVERYLSSSADDKENHCSVLLDGLRQAISGGHYEAASAAIRKITLPDLDYTTAQSLCRLRARLRGKGGASRSIRVAIIGGFTTKQIATFIDLCLFANGVDMQLYESEYDTFRQEVYQTDSDLYAFKPQVVWLAVNRRNLNNLPAADQSPETLENLLSAERADWISLWQKLQEHANCEIIQNNFVLPACRPLANFEMRSAGGFARFISDLNHALFDAAPKAVTIHDVEHIAATAGRWIWDDSRFVHHAKLPCAPEYIFDYAHNVASIISAQLGMARKCMVLDLDNTLWGGVIGDDGIDGITLGHGTASGEAFVEFQEYIKSLQSRGTILAICSKNNEDVARRVFEKHPEIVLKLEHISCFFANWNDKASNVRAIAEQLNIGLASMVFIDDNPAERAIIRRLLPEVGVPELPDDVTGYIRAVEQHRYFQVLSLATEDFQRAEYYRIDSMRRETQTSVTDIDSYLKSLEMIGMIAPVTESNMQRVAQLIQRSNQFNLMTRRYSIADLSRFIREPNWMTATLSLRDRFGDNGLISVALAEIDGDTMHIAEWLMSCRVLKRGVEHCVLNHIALVARQRGLMRLQGQYIPSPKNDMVRNHYEDMGFRKLAEDKERRTTWELLLRDWAPRVTHIELQSN